MSVLCYLAALEAEVIQNRLTKLTACATVLAGVVGCDDPVGSGEFHIGSAFLSVSVADTAGTPASGVVVFTHIFDGACDPSVQGVRPSLGPTNALGVRSGWMDPFLFGGTFTGCVRVVTVPDPAQGLAPDSVELAKVAFRPGHDEPPQDTVSAALVLRSPR